MFKAVEKSEMVWLLNHSNKGQCCLVLFYSLLNSNNSSFSTIFIFSQSNWRIRWEEHQKCWNNYATAWNNDLQCYIRNVSFIFWFCCCFLIWNIYQVNRKGKLSFLSGFISSVSLASPQGSDSINSCALCVNKINVAELHSTPAKKGFNSFLSERNWDTYEFNFSYSSIYSRCLHQGRIQNKKQLEPFLYTSPAIHINNPSKHKCAGNSHTIFTAPTFVWKRKVTSSSHLE